MNGIINDNFLLGFVLSKDRPRQEAVTTALTAGQFPRGSVVGTVLLKQKVDQIEKVERERDEKARLLASVLEQYSRTVKMFREKLEEFERKIKRDYDRPSDTEIIEALEKQVVTPLKPTVQEVLKLSVKLDKETAEYFKLDA